MKKFFLTFMCVIMLFSLMTSSVNALVIYDSNNNAVGTSVLTSSDNGRIYSLVVTDYDGIGAYGAIYLYDINGNLISGGWDAYKQVVYLTRGDASIAPARRSIRSAVDGYQYIYYDE